VTGNSRTYFAKDEASLLAHGNSVKAKQIPSSPFWVVTNNNTNRKGLIVTNVMREMGLPKKLIKRVQGLFV
ncbi:MAG: replication initiation regulator SeqA, partial [Haemophilus parahaemolyticus]|nr:replication initiation regulator SeqA [Haemophilus parahaemolyticus]